VRVERTREAVRVEQTTLLTSAASDRGRHEGHRKLAFIHINRAAGSSVTLGLGSCGEAAAGRFYHQHETADSPNRVAASSQHGGGSGHERESTPLSIPHLTAREWMAEWSSRTGTCAARQLGASACSAAWRHAVFSFAIVRNPYDRMISIFHSLMERECGPSRHTARSPSRQCQLRRFPPVDDSWRAGAEVHVAHFRRWVSDLDAAYPVGSMRNALFSATAGEYTTSTIIIHVRPQSITRCAHRPH